MKIALVSRRFDKNSGSAEWIYSYWLKENLIREGFEVYEIEQKNASVSSSRIKKMCYDFFVLPTRLLYCRLFEGIKTFHFLSENQATYAWLIKLFKGKTITQFYDIVRIKNKKFGLDKLYFSVVYRLASLSEKIICISSSTSKDVHTYLNIKNDKIEIIYPIYRSFKPKRPKENKKFVIGYLGALDKRKRVDLLIELAEKIEKAKISDLAIEIWGRGNLYEELKEKSKNFGNIVSLRGFASEKELEKTYNSFDFFVFPSKYEGFGLPVIEAMMCGKPSFILDDGYFPKEVKDGCIVCRNTNEIFKKITELMKNRKAYGKFSEKSLQYSKKFTPQNNFKKLINIYKKLLK